MTDWVHCNTCFRQPGSGPKFALTNCGHIFCGDCLEGSTKEKCKMCGNPCTSITLSAKMKPDVELYFTDPAEILKKHQKQLVMVLDFQKNHRQRLTGHRREVQSRHVSILESAKERMKEMECEVIRLKEENRKLRSLVSGSSGSNTSLKCSQRQLTPGRVLSRSPASSTSSIGRMVHQTPSPCKNRGSPFSRPSYPTTPTAMDVSKGSMQSPQVVTPGPARYCIRTPPSGGRMGTITPTSCATMMPTSSKMTAPSTPSFSPFSNSPTAYNPRSGYGTHDRRNTPGAGGDAIGRKQIQLNYTPHRRPPVLGMSISASQP
ncbi:probable E3 SUMO-protein ligase RNF212 [Strongylocentrotus purpuratus]|uniref:RING-type domain-containing protein n=1 Tax=Strongylocentrotus purpuratus TaxID=7668 RepID=A0A7M7N6A6_STRPU|nr:probable E3 SUMO-protein ligase RNF212 [Strongylocentrotus purpuratus]